MLQKHVEGRNSWKPFENVLSIRRRGDRECQFLHEN